MATTSPRDATAPAPPTFTASPTQTPTLRPDDVDPISLDNDGPRRRPQRAITVEGEGSHDREGRLRGSREGTGETRRSSRSRRRTIDPNAGPLRRMTTSLFTPEKPVGPAPTYLGSLKAAILSSWV